MSQALRALAGQPFELLATLERWLRQGRLGQAADDSPEWTGLAFRVGEQALLAPKAEVREVIVPPPVTRVPNAREWLLGLANVRGALITVVDLHRLCLDRPSLTQRAQRVLILNSDRYPLGFLVDEVVGYRSFEPGDQRPMAPADDVLAPFTLGSLCRESLTRRVVSLYQLAASERLRQAGW